VTSLNFLIEIFGIIALRQKVVAVAVPKIAVCALGLHDLFDMVDGCGKVLIVEVRVVLTA
jgi:hypothetical protein